MQYLLLQVTGKLKIGTYTGPLQHGIVYSGGEAEHFLSCEVALTCHGGLHPLMRTHAGWLGVMPESRQGCVS